MHQFETDVLIVGSGPAGSSYGSITQHLWNQECCRNKIQLACPNSPGSHHQSTSDGNIS